MALALALALGWLSRPCPLLAQGDGSGTVRGTVIGADGARLAAIDVTVEGTGLTATTRVSGRYELFRVPVGPVSLLFRAIGYVPQRVSQVMLAGATLMVNVTMETHPIELAEVIVVGASRLPERIVDAPAAVSIVPPAVLRSLALSGQAPLALATVPGVEVVQNGVNDYNLNARGFNSSLSRRVLVLQDGRDLAMPFFGSQEWGALTTSLQDMGTVEVIRGPGSALYGPSAYSGVVNIRTPAVRQAPGTRVTLGGGELGTVRADLRHAAVHGDGRWGYRATVGYARSGSWSRSRTRFDGSDLPTEYREATSEFVLPLVERAPLAGQTIDSANGGAAVGNPEDIVTMSGALRFDWYPTGRAFGTVEGGVTRVQNEVTVTGIGRMQIPEAMRPWARMAWTAPSYSLLAYYSGRTTPEVQILLGPAAPVKETSAILQLEGQYHLAWAEDGGRLVLGASARNQRINTEQTLILPARDDRSDYAGSVYGQIEYQLSPRLRAVAATRVDDGDLFTAQFSPKAALVWTPGSQHSVRLSVNRAFQPASALELFGQGRAGAPANLSGLETALRASSLGPALAPIPVGQLFTTSSAVPVFARGNGNLSVEKIVSLELGYKAQLSRGVFVSVDGYLSRLTNFVTDLLPGVNPDYPGWTAPAGVPAAAQDSVVQAVHTALLAAGQTVAALGLTRMPDGSSAIVVSHTNAGKVIERGVEAGATISLGHGLTLEGNYSYFGFSVKEKALADQLLPNSPTNTGNLALSYAGPRLDVRGSVRLVDGYPWAAGRLFGYVPARESAGLEVGYLLHPQLRFNAIATNLFDQRRFQIYGGSVVGRRVLAGFTGTF